MERGLQQCSGLNERQVQEVNRFMARARPHALAHRGELGGPAYRFQLRPAASPPDEPPGLPLDLDKCHLAARPMDDHVDVGVTPNRGAPCERSRGEQVAPGRAEVGS
jgi:hypothetical protein